MGCRGYLVGNGFPRVLRHSPTTDIHSISKNETCFQAKWTKSDLYKNSELNEYLWKSQRNQATSNPISSLIQTHPFPSSFHCHTIRPIGCDHTLLPVESPKSKQTTNHLHPIQQFLFLHTNLKPLH